ncbi:nucleotidyltransferase [Peribacillus sp. SCS-26]|uniref:nucleotidyltransferase n=1 Tax=Paraperibacillus marinus TaxID=3115295 RepID=UPI003905C282
MTYIKNIGRLCSTDQSGFIINDSNTKNIQSEYYPLIEEIIITYKRRVGPDLHSIYVRGSIPRGLGIHGVSDLDTIAITHTETKKLDLNWVGHAERELNKKYNCVNGVEFSFYSIDDIKEFSHFSMIPFMIKTHSVCVYGEDLSIQLPSYKADKTLGNEHLVNLESQIELAKKDLDHNEDKEDILDCCGWIMKILVRAGLALLIEEEKKYTRDLYPAYKIFSEHFPERESDMKQAVTYAINPIDNPQKIIDFLNEMGKWMVSEARKWLQIHNPHRIKNMEI